MRITEIRNKLFGLSDLKGLIRENTFDEGRKGFNFINFFRDDPERLNLTYGQFAGSFPEFEADERYNPFKLGLPSQDSFKQGRRMAKQGLAASKNGINVLMDYFKENNGQIISPAALSSGNPDEVRKYFQDISELALNAIRYVQGENINIGDVLKQNEYRVGDVSEPFSMFLYFIFCCCNTKQGVIGVRELKNSIAPEFRRMVDMEEMRMKGLLSGREYNLADDGEENGGLDMSNSELIQYFILNKIGARSGELLTDGILQTLYGAYFSSESGLQELMSGISEMRSRKPNISFALTKENFRFNTVGGLMLAIVSLLTTKHADIRQLVDNIVTFLPGESLSGFRNAIYRVRYSERAGIVFPDNFLEGISESFGIPRESLFDPLYNVDDERIKKGVERYVMMNGGKEDSLRPLIKISLCFGLDNIPPIERIFQTAKTLNDLLRTDFSKRLGASGHNVLNNAGLSLTDKISLLLGGASEGMRLLIEDAERRGYSEALGNLPAGINNLNNYYRGVSKNGEKETPFMDILSRNSDTKTQDEVFYFLMSVSDPDIEWQSEYNRYEGEKAEKGEEGLGRKTIDIMGKKFMKDIVNGQPVKTNKVEERLCFEYQGEQHYRPVNVTPADYSYSLYSEMREEILINCGFVSGKVKKNGNRTYFWAVNDLPSDEITMEMRQIIIDVYKSQIKKLTYLLNNNKGYQDKVVTEGSGTRGGINRKALGLFKYSEALRYFREVVSKGAGDTAQFSAPPIDGMVPYLCSPCRFADEILTAIDLQRDRIKSDIIFNRKKLGWKMAYVTPKLSPTFTEEDLKYTVKELARNDSGVVFTWDKEGKAKMTGYLVQEGFKTPEVIKESTLFEQIFREIRNDYGS